MTSREGNRKELCHLESTHLSSNPGPPLTMWSQTLPARQARSEQKNNLRFSWLKTKVIYFSLMIIMSTWIFWGFCSTSLSLGQDLNAKEQSSQDTLLVWKKTSLGFQIHHLQKGRGKNITCFVDCLSSLERLISKYIFNNMNTPAQHSPPPRRQIYTHTTDTHIHNKNRGERNP